MYKVSFTSSIPPPSNRNFMKNMKRYNRLTLLNLGVDKLKTNLITPPDALISSLKRESDSHNQDIGFYLNNK